MEEKVFGSLPLEMKFLRIWGGRDVSERAKPCEKRSLRRAPDAFAKCQSCLANLVTLIKEHLEKRLPKDTQHNA